MEAETRKLFYRNLELWGRSQPKAAPLMPYLDLEELKFCHTECGELNLWKTIDQKTVYFHSQEGAYKEAERWFTTISINKINALYVFGIGLGYYYFAARDWLHADIERTLIFLEDEAAVLCRFFETEAAAEILQDSQVHIILLQDLTSKKKVLEEAYWRAPLAKAQVSALKFYKESREQLFTELSHEITYSSELTRALTEEYLDGGASYFVNYYQNLLCAPSSYLGNQLFGKFTKVPAIICGAGPSLEKNMHLLKDLKEKALIFAGGSAINILNSASIQPHLCAAIDPNTAQNVRLVNTQAFEVPFFYRNRVNHSAFTTIHGPRLYTTGSGGYDIAKFFESRLGITGEDLEEGHNVITFMLEIAHLLGCDPIIFVGMDLAFTDRKTYSAGVVFDPSVEQKTLDEYANFETTGILRKDIYGMPIYTLWKWIAESEWLGEWAKEHPHVHLFNCTEGGLGLPAITNMALKDAVDKFLNVSYDLQGRIHAEIQNSQLPDVTEEKVNWAIEELKLSLIRSEQHLDILIEDAERVLKIMDSEKRVPSPLQSGLAALAEIELTEEVAYDAVIAIFNQVYSSLINYELQQIYHQEFMDVYSQQKRTQLNLKRLNFLREVVRVNLATIDHAFERKASMVQHRSSIASEDIKLELHSHPLTAASQEEEVQYQYYPSGSIKGETYYQKGILHGPSRYYSEEGHLLADAQYYNGCLEGKCFWYYLSGELYSKQFFVLGLPDGPQNYFHKNGSIKSQLFYNNGHLVSANLYTLEGAIKRSIKTK